MTTLPSPPLSTREAEAFRKHSDKLLYLLQPADITSLGMKLFARGIISQSVKEEVGNRTFAPADRINYLCDAMIRYLVAWPDKFKKVLEIFAEELVYKDLADAIEETYSKGPDSSLDVAQLLPPAMRKYAAYLRDCYKISAFPTISKWPSPPCQKVIKLAATETKGEHVPTNKGLNPKTLAKWDSIDEFVQSNDISLFSLSNLLDSSRSGKSPRLVIVQGAPGIGKSTFAWKFCQDWAEGMLYQEYDLVVLLRMRDKKVQEAKELKDLFEHMSKKLSENVAEEVIERNGEKVIFMFEGLDEIPPHCISEGSFLLKILRGALPRLTIVVTSRPWAVEQLLNLCNNQITRRVDILGFLREDISEYIRYSFAETDLPQFMEYFSTHPQLETIMYSPLNCAFVVEIYKDLQQRHLEEDFPRTLTQLYTALVKRSILQHINQQGDSASVKLKSIDLYKLSEPINSIFQQVCQIAFQSFTKICVQVSFDDSEVGNVDTLGLMQSVPDRSLDSDNRMIHSFLHFTIQEYLAAFHLSLQDSERQELFFQVHQSDPKFSVLLTFLIGLNSSIVRHLKRPTPSSEIEPHILHWLFESQSPPNIAAYLGKDLVYFQTYSKLAPIDIYSLTYCLRHSDCTWNIIVDLEGISTIYTTSSEINSESILTKNVSTYSSTHTSTTSFKGHIDELSVFNAQSSAIHKFFVYLPQYLFKTIHFLYLYNREEINIDDNYYSIIASIFAKHIFENLSEFQFNDAPRVRGIGEVIEALHSSCSRLETLKIERCLFTLSDMILLCQCLSSGISNLSRLALIHVKFEEDTLKCLNSALPHAKTLKRLDLSFNKLEHSDIEMLALATEMSTLEALRLRSCSINADGAEVLAGCLENNHTIIFLSLAQNSISFRGAAALAEALKVNTILRDIRLNGDDSIGRNGAGLLIDTLLNHNQDLDHLEMALSCKPVEYGSALMATTNRVKFV